MYGCIPIAFRLKEALILPLLCSRWPLCIRAAGADDDTDDTDADAPATKARSPPLPFRSNAESSCELDSIDSLSSEGIAFNCLSRFGLNMVICVSLLGCFIIIRG